MRRICSKVTFFPQTKSEVVVFPSQHLDLCRESKEIALYESGFATRSRSLRDLATSGCNCSENDLWELEIIRSVPLPPSALYTSIDMDIRQSGQGLHSANRNTAEQLPARASLQILHFQLHLKLIERFNSSYLTRMLRLRAESIE